MKHAVRLLILVAALVTWREPVQAEPCPHLFKANAQNSSSYIEYCVSDNGNIIYLNSPFDVRQLESGEGYGLCQESPVVEYHDYLTTASGNWAAAQLLSVGASSIKIKRSTGDGNWTLVQTISKLAATGSIKISMALTNNQSVQRIAYLLRWANTSEPLFEPHTVGASLNSAWNWENGLHTLHYGLQLLNAGVSPFAYRQGFALSTGEPNACAFANASFARGVSALTSSDTSIAYAYVGAVRAGATRTVTLNYRGT